MISKTVQLLELLYIVTIFNNKIKDKIELVSYASGAAKYYTSENLEKKEELALILNLPSSEAQELEIEKKEISIEINKDKLSIYGKEISFEELDEKLSVIKEKKRM